MKRPALLALALAAAACGSAGVRTASEIPAQRQGTNDCTPEDIVRGVCIGGCTASIPPICSYWRLRGASGLVGTLLPPLDPVVVTAPLLPPTGGVVLYHADPKCPPAIQTVTLPDPARRDCYALRARLALVGRLLADHVEPGDASPCAQFLSPTSFANCLDIEARRLPRQTYGLSAQWVSGLRVGVPWSGCATGIAYADYTFASLANPSNVLNLVAWEAANNLLGYAFDRMDLTDGSYVSAATTAAKAACGEI